MGSSERDQTTRHPPQISSLVVRPTGSNDGEDGRHPAAGEVSRDRPSFARLDRYKGDNGYVDHSLEDLDDPFYGSSDEEYSEARVLDNDNKLRREKFHTAGYRDGIVAGKEAIAQEGYNFGYKESVFAGYKFGIVRGVSSALAFLPDELKEKLIDEQETKEKFKKLHSSVHALSTEVAMKRFYEASTKQGEEKSGEEGSDSGSGPGVNATTDLGSYITELSFLLDKSPKIEIKFDT